MAGQTDEQKETVERVMHEFKEGELISGSGRKVKNPRQAIAIALHEAGASNQESPAENRRNLKRTKAKEARGETARDVVEGRGGRVRTKADLYAEARRRNVLGRSKMSRDELERALSR